LSLVPQSREETRTVAETAVEAGVERLIVAGGDGTLRDAASALVGSPTALAIVPCGTANDYAVTAGIPRDLHRAWELATTGEPVAVDIARVNGTHISLNLAGLGFDAEVVRAYHTAGAWQKKMPPRVRYYLSIAATFRKFRGVRARLCLDDEEVVIERLLLLAFGAARQYGDGMVIAPDARLADGRLDAVWATELSTGELMGLLPKLSRAGHVGHPKVSFRTFQRMRVETEPPMAFHIEGDLFGQSPLEIEVVPGALRLVAGPEAKL
jgi:diacylglycerol kinase (ATP)